jgi:hypothetical protein
VGCQGGGKVLVDHTDQRAIAEPIVGGQELHAATPRVGDDLGGRHSQCSS